MSICNHWSRYARRGYLHDTGYDVHAIMWGEENVSEILARCGGRLGPGFTETAMYRPLKGNYVLDFTGTEYRGMIPAICRPGDFIAGFVPRVSTEQLQIEYWRLSDFESVEERKSIAQQECDHRP